MWWRCHRRIIADHLLARGIQVVHIFDAGKAEPASLSPFARIRTDGRVFYPADVQEAADSPTVRAQIEQPQGVVTPRGYGSRSVQLAEKPP